MDSLYSVLVRPVVTEKSMQSQGSGKYTFLVDPRATKVEIQQAIEKLYATVVASVNIVPVRKKIRLIGRSKVYTKRQAGKKAIVTLEKGQSIDVMKIQEEKKKETKKKAPAKTAAKKEDK